MCNLVHFLNSQRDAHVSMEQNQGSVLGDKCVISKVCVFVRVCVFFLAYNHVL